jgi:hypothetical protein
MNNSKSRWLIIGLGLALVAGPNEARSADKKEKKEKPEKPAKTKPQRPTQPQPPQNRPFQERQQNQNPAKQTPPAQRQPEPKTPPVKARPNRAPEKAERKPPPITKPVRLTEEKKPDGVIERKRPSGAVAETVKVDQKTGIERTRRLSPGGRVESEATRKPDGTIHKAHYDLGGAVKKEEVVRKDGSKQVTEHRIGRDGNTRAKETIHYTADQKVVSKTVERNVYVTRNVVNRTVVVNHYDRCRYGFVYRPVYLTRPRLFISWYDPFWYNPFGVVIHHPFRFAWGWESYGWYRHYHGCYWNTYTVYPAPSYWVTDFLVAAYVADCYAASLSAAQAHEEARLAREEAEKARRAAEDARDQAEIAEARAAAAQAELRARNAEERAARAERQEARTGNNPNATPIDQETKEALRTQIEQTIAEQKELAEQSEKTGKPALPDLSKAFADPKRIYPVSKTISVVSAKDEPAGVVSDGDLLRIEPGQENILKDADENTEVLVRVMTSKGEENEVAAGTVIKVFVKDLQEFDSEFRAKLDEGLAAAENNKEAFKQGVVAQRD